MQMKEGTKLTVEADWVWVELILGRKAEVTTILADLIKNQW